MLLCLQVTSDTLDPRKRSAPPTYPDSRTEEIKSFCLFISSVLESGYVGGALRLGGSTMSDYSAHLPGQVKGRFDQTSQAQGVSTLTQIQTLRRVQE